MPLTVRQFPCLTDNYGFLARDEGTGATACIDTPDADAILAALAEAGWGLDLILNTHWHPDHAGGNAAIKLATGCKITAPAVEASQIEGVDRIVAGGDWIKLGAYDAEVIDVGGHTLGHIAYHLPEAGIAFVGDSVFALGCGRMFEGTAPQFWHSLLRLKALPPQTTLYCAHEYTAANARFALFADPDNAALADYDREITEKCARQQPTVPFNLGRELATNPFLRADDAALQARWGGGDAVATFAALREAKNNF
jgi:hydroxyacylglutathione hydrolase